MDLYHYTAYNPKGKTVQGTLKADSEKMVRNQLREQGLLPVQIESSSSERSQTAQKNRYDCRIPLTELALVTRELGSLLQAGLELEQSLQACATHCEHKKLKTILLHIHARIIEGYSFSYGLAQFPKAFPKVMRASLAAGEESGYVGEVLLHLASYLEMQQKMRQKILTIMLYPAILSIVAFSIVLFLLVYVAPKILHVFDQTSAQLPMVTQILMGMSAFLGQYGGYLFVAFIGFFVISKLLLAKPKIRAIVQKGLLRLPWLGPLLRLLQTGRFLRTLSLLTRANVPILKSLSVSSELVSFYPIKEQLTTASSRIREGMSVHKAFQQTGHFKATTLQLIASGEQSGNLEDMLLHAAQSQERHIEYATDTFLAVFEPLLILLMGAVVLFIVLAMLLPMFQISTLV